MRKLLAAAVSTLAMALLCAAPAQAGDQPHDPLNAADRSIAACADGYINFGIRTPVFSVGDVACVYGEIDKSMAASFNGLDMSRIDTIVIQSPGGSVASALDMAEHMGLFQKTLVVDGLCASSCANYLFLAARYKIVPDGAMVGWHGAPPRPEGWIAPIGMTATAAQFMGDTIIRSAAFFQRVGVTDRIARETSDGLEIARPGPGEFWSHSYNDLVLRYGVGGILYMARD
jgi:hypothetical protein